MTINASYIKIVVTATVLSATVYMIYPDMHSAIQSYGVDIDYSDTNEGYTAPMRYITPYTDTIHMTGMGIHLDGDTGVYSDSIVAMFVVAHDVCSSVYVELDEYINVISEVSKHIQRDVDIIPMAIMIGDDYDIMLRDIKVLGLSMPIHYKSHDDIPYEWLTFSGRYHGDNLIFVDYNRKRGLYKVGIPLNAITPVEYKYNVMESVIGDRLQVLDTT